MEKLVKNEIVARSICFVAAFLCLFYPTHYAHTEPSSYVKPLIVTVVQSKNSDSYLEFTKALSDNVRDKNIDLIVIDDPAKPLPDSDLVISVGMKAAIVIAGGKSTAILNVFLSKTGYEELLRDFPARANSKTFSAIFLDQPLVRQISLISAVLPGKHRIGVLFDFLPNNDLDRLRQQISKYGFSLHDRVISQTLPLQEALQKVLRESDMLLALPNSSIYNSSTLRNILLATYRSAIPLVGLSPSYVKAGALCAIFSTPTQIATQALLSIQQFGKISTLQAAQYPQLFEVMVNEQVGQSLGLTIKNLVELHKEISASLENAL